MPCGGAGEPPCQLCHLFVMLDSVLDFIILRLTPIVAVLMLVISGVMFMVANFSGAEMLPGGAQGGPQLLSQAKKTLTAAAFGLVIIFSAWIIINTFLGFIGVNTWTGLESGWWQINCPVK